MILMAFVEGQTFLELDRAPNIEEEKAVIEEAVKINRIDHRPTYFFDTWAIPNFEILFERVKQFIEDGDLKLIE